MRKGFILLFIILLASLLRLFQLGDMPTGLSNDEASYIYSSYSVWKTGRGIDGSFLPLSFNTDSSNSPVPIYLDAPFVGILGVSPFSGRLPYALCGIASVFLVYLISKKLFNNEWIALFSAFVLAVSPWHIHVSRAAFDTTVALFFYLLGMFLFLRNKEKGNILWSLLPFLLAFYSYHAMKFFYLFFLPFLLVLFWKDLRNKPLQKIIFCIGYVAILVSFIGVTKFNHVTRQDTTLLSFSDSNVVKTVNYERSTSTAPEFLRNIFNNKLLTVLRITRENILEPFSPQFLFLYGDTTSSGLLLGTFSRGVMYVIELPLLLLGLWTLLRRFSLKINVYLLGSIFLAVIPSGFTNVKSFVLRDLMMTPFLAIVVGVGLYELFVFLQKKPLKQFTLSLVCFLYLFLISGYLYQYYYRYPFYSSEAWMKNVRTVTTFIQTNTRNYKTIYVAYGASDQKIFFAQYGIFGKIDPVQIQKAWLQTNPIIGNVAFNYPCLKSKDGTFSALLPQGSLYVVTGDCSTNVSPQKTILDTSNPAQAIWKIYEL